MKIESLARLEQNELIVSELSQYALIEVTGEEAAKYLQGQLTCDVSLLPTLNIIPTAHCDPKGKVSGFFYLARQDENHFYLLVRQTLLPTALDNLKKYSIFSKVNFSLLSDKILGIAGKQASDWITLQQKCGQSSLVFSSELNNVMRYFMFTNEIEGVQPSQMWDILDIQLGIPVLSQAEQNEFLPQALNIQCLENAISFSKGCYIGQEMVARAKYRGANKRAMFTFFTEGATEAKLGSEIEMRLADNWRKTGKIISAVYFERILWLQVILNNQIEAETEFRLENGSEILQYSLPYSLA